MEVFEGKWAERCREEKGNKGRGEEELTGSGSSSASRDLISTVNHAIANAKSIEGLCKAKGKTKQIHSCAV